VIVLCQTTDPVTVRAVDYTIECRENAESYRLLTTITHPGQASAQDLAIAYAQRWEIENTFDELKTHQRRRKMPKWHVKRSHHATWPQPAGPPTATILSL